MSATKAKRRKRDSDQAHVTTPSCNNEFLSEFQSVVGSWSKDMKQLLDPTLSDEIRKELWEMMCEEGERLRRRYAWAIPDERALRIIGHFGPIVEVGCGLGYWARLLRDRGVDVTAYDRNGGDLGDVSRKADEQGVPNTTATGKESFCSTSGTVKQLNNENSFNNSFWTKVEEGGPEALEEDVNEKRALFLCYPDDFEGTDESLSMRCLHTFEGDLIIHAGELFGDSLSMNMGQTPWGRTTAQSFQQELASKFHCILKVGLPSWPHSRDALSVWKRHAFSTICYNTEEGSDLDQSSCGEREEEREERSVPLCGNSSPADISGGEEEGGGRGGAGEGGGGGGGDDSRGAGESRGERGSSCSGSEEPGGCVVPDWDVYAFIPDEERLPCDQAAECVRFLLE